MKWRITKQADTVGYNSISGRKIAAALLILICSFALAYAARGNKDNISVKPAQPLMAHTNQAPIGRGHAMHNHSTATGQAHPHHKQGALSNFKPHMKKSSRATHSKGTEQAGGQGGGGAGGGGGGFGSGSDVDQGAGQGAQPKSDTTPSPTPEESPGQTSDTTIGSSATITGTSRWPRAAATPAPLQ